MAVRGTNLVNAEHLSHAYSTRIILDDVTVGVSAGDVVGIVGANGAGKTTLMSILSGILVPDEGRITRNRDLTMGALSQVETAEPTGTVRDLVVGGGEDHLWASDARARHVVEHLMADIDFETPLAHLSGGERRRVSLVNLLMSPRDLLILDEPTNHLDVEAVAWLAHHLNELQAQGVAMLIISHDRWFLDEVCNRMWEIHDGVIDAYDGGYGAYVLARAERQRQAAAQESRRRNLVRKELAWLRRGAPARTSKPKFRIEAATSLIADVPEPRDRLQLQRFSTARLGKDVIDLHDVQIAFDDGTTLFDHLTWSIGPGDRIGLVGVNGSGKSTLFRLFAGDQRPSAGKVKYGSTLRVGHLSQHLEEMDSDERVLDWVNRVKAATKLATGKETTASSLLEDFGFTGDRLVARIGELSGGERRRLQFLKLLMEEPNVLLLDEPTNDLDIDTLTVIEDYLDTWAGTLIVASHDRYFLERVADVVYGITDDGRCLMLPRGVEQYLEGRRAAAEQASAPAPATVSAPSNAATQRAAKKALARIESQLDKAHRELAAVHEQMAAHASDIERLTDLNQKATALQASLDELEEQWLAHADEVSD